MPSKDDQLHSLLPDESDVLDVLIIGAGPAGLGVASRLQEETPSALFTDEEHHRYHWIKKHTGRMALAQVRHNHKQKNNRSSSKAEKDTLSSSSSSSVSRYSTLVLDSSSDKWLAKWRWYFCMLEIQQLRSPMFFHVDPADRDGMLAFARETGREEELWELRGCVGREVSKHKRKKRSNARLTGEPEINERDRKDYYSPSSEFFFEYCESVASRCGLNKPRQILQHEVEDIKFDYVPHLSVPEREQERIFRITTKDGYVVYSRAVVLATGPGNGKNYPWRLMPEEENVASHVFDVTTLPSPNVRQKIKERKETNVVIVGGGLTAAQISDVLIRRGVSKVWLLMRSDLKVKHFDVGLNWVGKFRNYEKAAFWSAEDDDERLDMINMARNGGSINPRYHRILKQHIASKRLSLHTRTVISTKQCDTQSKSWSLSTDPPIPDLTHNTIDYIYFATGVKMDVNETPMFRNMNTDYPIDTKGGLPCLNNDLMWRDDVPLFCTGKLAMLRLGPAAPNLEGARAGAERISWALDAILGKGKKGGGEGEGEEFEQIVSFTGLGNRYAGLVSAEQLAG